jgi:phosphoribosylformylglycinamidine synthase subunit PurS
MTMNAEHHVTEYQVEIRITPRAGLLDPQGKAVQHALHSLDFGSVEDVRVGRLIRIRVQADSDDAARRDAAEMCRKLLANPVTEDFEIDLRQAV